MSQRTAATVRQLCNQRVRYYTEDMPVAKTTQGQHGRKSKKLPAFTIDPRNYYSVGELQEMGSSRDGRRKLEQAGARPRSFGRCRVYLGSEIAQAIEQQVQ